MKLEPLNLNLLPNSNFEWGLIGLEHSVFFEPKQIDDSLFGGTILEGIGQPFYPPELHWRIVGLKPMTIDLHLWVRYPERLGAVNIFVTFLDPTGTQIGDTETDHLPVPQTWTKISVTKTLPENIASVALKISPSHVEDIFQIDRVFFGKDATPDNYEFHDLPIVPFTYRTSKQEQRIRTQTGKTVVTRTGFSKRAFNMEFRASRQSHFLSLRRLYENYSYFYFYPNLKTEREVYLVHWPEDAFEFRELPGGNLYDGDMILEEV
jgi:hypothetical protein